MCRETSVSNARSDRFSAYSRTSIMSSVTIYLCIFTPPRKRDTPFAKSQTAWGGSGVALHHAKDIHPLNEGRKAMVVEVIPTFECPGDFGLAWIWRGLYRLSLFSLMGR